VVALGHGDLEITNPESVTAALETADADMVINSAAYNLVDRAEDEPEAAFAVNAFGTRNLAQYCAERDIPLLHVSTDYVFSGYEDETGYSVPRSIPYRETDTPLPLSAYGSSKLAGEYFVHSLCRRHFVVRTCGLYGHRGATGKGNFVETMLRLGGERDELSVVDDQRCTPSATADVAAGIAALIETDAYGLYHATNSGDVSWCELATEIFRLSDMAVTVKPITSAQFGAKARRAGYSVLNNEKLKSATGCELPAWQDALSRYLTERNDRAGR